MSGEVQIGTAKRFFTQRVVGNQSMLPREVVTAWTLPELQFGQHSQELGGFLVLFSADLGAGLDVVSSQCRHSVILLRCGQLRYPLASSGFVSPHNSHAPYRSFTLFWAALTRADQAQNVFFQTLLKPKPSPGAIRVSLERCCALGNTCKAAFEH